MEAIARYRIAPNTLTVHQDRGAPMIAHSYLDLMLGFDVTCSHSRPRVSNDNAFSESQFTRSINRTTPADSTALVMLARGQRKTSTGITSIIITVV